jgi:hypothetical protein
MLDRFGKSLCGSMVLLADAGPAKLLMAVAMADLPGSPFSQNALDMTSLSVDLSKRLGTSIALDKGHNHCR